MNLTESLARKMFTAGWIYDKWDNATDANREMFLNLANIAVETLQGWQSIETAPKDGTEVLTCIQGYAAGLYQWVEFEGHGRWSVDPETFMQEEHFEEYFRGTSYTPTHFMFPPPPPQAKE